MVPEVMTKGGISSWTAGLAAGSSVARVICSSLVLGVGALAQYRLAVRFTTSESDRELNRSLAVFILVCMASCFLALYAAEVFWSRLTRAGAVAGIFSVIVMSAFRSSTSMRRNRRYSACARSSAVARRCRRDSGR